MTKCPSGIFTGIVCLDKMVRLVSKYFRQWYMIDISDSLNFSIECHPATI